MYPSDAGKVTPESVTAKKRSNKTFVCSSETPVKWQYRDSMHLYQPLPNNVIIQNQNLIVHSIQLSHRGYYECEGSVVRTGKTSGEGKFYSEGELMVIGKL